jgi:putative endonuclease
MGLSLSRWPWFRRWFGSKSERAAEKFLKKLGYRILTRNYCCPGGELDLVALDGREVVFVEVRSTAGEDAERPTASIDREKQRKVSHAARHFAMRHRLGDVLCRFDILILCWPANQKEPKVIHYPNAFEVIGQW